MTGPGNDQRPGDDAAAIAGRDRLGEQVIRTGAFGTGTTGDTSGYGGLRVRKQRALSSERAFGSYFDEVADALGSALEASGLSFGDAVERVVAANGELTFYVRREHLVEVARRLRDDPALAFELCLGVSGTHYPADAGRELHAVYHLLSITRNRRLRVEVIAPDADPHVPSLVDVYPTNDWHERRRPRGAARTRPAARCASGRRTGTRRRGPAARPARRAAGPPVPARIPTGPAGLARRARQRPGRQVSGRGTGIQAQQHGRQLFPVVSVMNPASRAPAAPARGRSCCSMHPRRPARSPNRELCRKPAP